jgi:probable HAF family extracellular repeat protein
MTLTVSSPSDIGAFSSVSYINDQDEVVGSGNGGTTGFVWQNGQTATLPVVDGDQSGVATGVNDQGQIVGYSSAGDIHHSISWQNGLATLLPGLGASTRDYAINDQGVIVGSAEDSNGLAVATEIVDGTVIQLPLLPGGYLDNPTLADGRAFAINDGGQIVGLSMTPSGLAHAVLWQNGTVTDLGVIAGGGLSIAQGINQSGTDIVGYAVDVNGIDQAVVWQNGTMTILPDHNSNGHSIAFGVNDAGIVVGRSDVLTPNGGWQQDAVLWQNGVLIDLNSFLPTNSGWVLNVAQSINDNGEIAGIGTYDGMTAGFVLSIGDSSGPMVTASAALQAFKAAPHSAALSVLDTAADIQVNLDGLQGIASVGKLLQIQISDSAALTVTAGQLTADADALADISGSYSLHATGETINDAYGVLAAPHVASVEIADTAFSVAGALYQLQSWAAAGQLSGITVTDSQDPLLGVTAQQVDADSLALKAIQGSYQLTISDATVAQALTFSADYTVSSVQITDSIDAAVAAASQLQAMTGSYSLDLGGSAADLATNFNALANLKRSSFTQVTVTDSDFPTVSITAQQAQGATTLLFGLQGKFILSIDASQLASGLIEGAPAVATVVAFPNAASDYVLSTWDGSYLSVENTATGGKDLLVQVTAVQFADGTDFVVQAPSTTGVTSGNVAELYAAVLARTPDVAGLAYYDSLIQSGSGPSMLQLAEYFLTSPEYVNNPAHAYAQSAAGDAKFITDTYQNLLHRAPDSGAVPFYQNVINQFTAGFTPGTAAYATAQMQGHAQVLVYFSASQEFLNDVQITAQHPADAQHWLYVL